MTQRAMNCVGYFLLGLLLGVVALLAFAASGHAAPACMEYTGAAAYLAEHYHEHPLIQFDVGGVPGSHIVIFVSPQGKTVTSMLVVPDQKGTSLACPLVAGVNFKPAQDPGA